MFIEENKGKREAISRQCVFCEIVADREPAGRILETSRLLVITAREGGYPLILTKEHFSNILDPKLDDDTAKDLGLMQRDMAKVVTRIDGVSGVSVVTSNGHNAGQEVPHLHIHVMPRVEGDRRIRVRLGEAMPIEERNSRAVMYREAIKNLQDI